MNWLISILIIGVIITGSIEHISLPLIVGYYPSLYFIIIVSSLHGSLNYGILLTIVSKCHITVMIDIIKPQWKTVLIAGSCNALMSLCFIYSTSPTRTPVVIQSIFLGLAILPTVGFRKVLLNKQTKYNRKYIIPSIILLVISVILSVIPLFVLEYDITQSYWIVGYIMAIILLSFDNTMQEKYVTDTKDERFINKLTFAFSTSICQVIVLLCCFWMELIFGYSDTPVLAFTTSLSEFVTQWSSFLFLEFFIVDCLVLYLISIYLNSMSTNYNMILTNLTNQSVAIFFIIFPSLNTGIHYPVYIVIPTLILNCISVFLWIKGETNYEKELPNNKTADGIITFPSCENSTLPIYSPHIEPENKLLQDQYVNNSSYFYDTPILS